MKYNKGGEFFRKGKKERQARAWIDKNSSSKGSNDEHIDNRQRKLAVPLFGELDVYLDYVHFSFFDIRGICSCESANTLRRAISHLVYF